MSGRFAAALARLDSIRKTLPQGRIPEKYVRAFHSALADIEKASGESYEAYQVPENELRQDVIATRPGGRSVYSEDRRCDRAFFLMQLDALVTFLESSEEPAKAPPGFGSPK